MKRILTLSLLVLLSLGLNAQKTIIHAGKLIDGKSDQVMTSMSIVIEGNKIVSVDRGYTKGGNEDQVIDLKDKTVMPGLIHARSY